MVLSMPRIKGNKTITAEDRAKRIESENKMIAEGSAVRCPECGCVVNFLVAGMCADCDSHYTTDE